MLIVHTGELKMNDVKSALEELCRGKTGYVMNRDGTFVSTVQVGESRVIEHSPNWSQEREGKILANKPKDANAYIADPATEIGGRQCSPITYYRILHG